MNPHSPIKTRNKRKAAAQAQRRADPVRRSLEQSVIKRGCASKQAKFRVLKIDVSQGQPRQPDRKTTEDSAKTH